MRNHPLDFLFQEVLENCEVVLESKGLLQCLSSPQVSKVVLELHKLSLAIKTLKQKTTGNIFFPKKMEKREVSPTVSEAP